ncbi:MAG: T9SS type A sorting domain-containing protein [bacterium]
MGTKRFIRAFSVVAISFSWFTISIYSQYKEINGIKFPVDFKIQQSETEQSFSKTLEDTIHYETLPKLKDDFQVNVGCGDFGANQAYIKIANDPEGGFMCVWNDFRNGDKQVNAQLFDRNCQRIGDVIYVSEGNANWNSAPNIVFNKVSKEYIITWAGTGHDILFQRINLFGEKISLNITTNQFYRTNTNNPSAAIDKCGNIIITWTSDVYCCLNEKNYYRIFDKEGNSITDQWSPNGPQNNHITSGGRDNRITSDSTGRCMIVWSCSVNGQSEIVMQGVDTIGNLYSEPIVISEPALNISDIFPTITCTNDGFFLIVWNADKNIDGRIFNPELGFVTPEFTIAEFPYYGAAFGISSDCENNFYIFWFADGAHSLVISKYGSVIQDTKEVTFESPIKWGNGPSLSQNIAGIINLAYCGNNRYQSDVMLQQFDDSFLAKNASIKVADDDCSSSQKNPKIKFNKTGVSLIIWEDSRNGYNDLYGQILDENGDPLNSNFKINTDANILWASDAIINIDNENNFLVLFSGGRDNYRNLVIQKISQVGTLIGPNHWITEGYEYSSDYFKNIIQQNKNGDIFLTWYSVIPSNVYTQKVNSSLIPKGEPKIIFTSSDSSPKYVLDISTNQNFNTLLVWKDYNMDTAQEGKILYAAVMNSEGKIVRDKFEVATISPDKSFNMCDCVIDDENNLTIMWSECETYGYKSNFNVKRYYNSNNDVKMNSFVLDYVNAALQILSFEDRKLLVAWEENNKLYSYLFNDFLSTYSAILLHEFDVPYSPYFAFSGDVINNKILLSYESPQNRETGFDIYANIQTLDQNNIYMDAPGTESLTSAYPNPSENTVSFQYAITKQANISVAVYNILGQKIAELENGSKEPGIYTVNFNTENLAAGVYFFYYHGIDSYSKKFIVVK